MGLALPNYYIIETPNQIYLSNSEGIKEIYAECKNISLQGYIAYDFVYCCLMTTALWGTELHCQEPGLEHGERSVYKNSTKSL